MRRQLTAPLSAACPGGYSTRLLADLKGCGAWTAPDSDADIMVRLQSGTQMEHTSPMHIGNSGDATFKLLQSVMRARRAPWRSRRLEGGLLC